VLHCYDRKVGWEEYKVPDRRAFRRGEGSWGGGLKTEDSNRCQRGRGAGKERRADSLTGGLFAVTDLFFDLVVGGVSLKDTKESLGWTGEKGRYE